MKKRIDHKTIQSKHRIRSLIDQLRDTSAGHPMTKDARINFSNFVAENVDKIVDPHFETDVSIETILLTRQFQDEGFVSITISPSIISNPNLIEISAFTSSDDPTNTILGQLIQSHTEPTQANLLLHRLTNAFRNTEMDFRQLREFVFHAHFETQEPDTWTAAQKVRQAFPSIVLEGGSSVRDEIADAVKAQSPLDKDDSLQPNENLDDYSEQFLNAVRNLLSAVKGDSGNRYFITISNPALSDLSIAGFRIIEQRSSITFTCRNLESDLTLQLVIGEISSNAKLLVRCGGWKDAHSFTIGECCVLLGPDIVRQDIPCDLARLLLLWRKLTDLSEGLKAVKETISSIFLRTGNRDLLRSIICFD